ncbi:sugar ABC transporter ATP-binding protein [Phototrophicus methaneseepsis]|uniref:Sugar ABC transporter ATP-binding protein n=1 Tax=Phototrophicus methaneseepsis TaxID=2710758 RepID=A0A7S8EBC2_9CHLR|nr:sugar ABC transporter ATP-binding protein [Phototrophicus methaneseepsis]QPC83853.1 sugar ABC transporter ATP-binding protein [Phototrophicus methaneseepsis]
MNAHPPSAILQTRGLSKSFGSVDALVSVDFNLRVGEIHALLGENGAGKSTLIKLITGVYAKDSGEILLDGEVITPHNPREAQQIGISPVYQEINLIPTMSVAENIYLGRQPMRFGMVNNNAMHRQAKALLNHYNIDIDVTRTLSSYSVAIQQLVAIARGVDMSAKVLILDEPTASLDRKEVDILFEVMRQLKADGIGIILITHFLDQVYEISDRITVLRNGHKVGEYITADLPRVQLISEMLGHELTETLGKERATFETKLKNGDAFIQIENMARKGYLSPISIDINQGEIVGLAGLLGSGRTETALLIFGIENRDQGTIHMDGEAINLRSPSQAIQYGFALCPEDRKTDGIVGELTVRENIILALQAKLGWFNFIPMKRQQHLADEMIAALHIATPDAEKPAGQLSGGNQQKVILARWLASEPKFLILDEPTRGIDVGAHAEIINIIKRLSHEGMSLLVISSELAEVVDYSDRVVVLRDRQMVAELTGEDINENRIMQVIAEGQHA